MKGALVYLDVCALIRPFDDQSFLRIRLETEAVNLILSRVHKGMVWQSCAFLPKGGFTIKSERYLAEEATTKKGVEALIRELGPVEAMRFLSIPRERRQESVKRHREWQKTLDKKKLFDEVFGQVARYIALLTQCVIRHPEQIEEIRTIRVFIQSRIKRSQINFGLK